MGVARLPQLSTPALLGLDHDKAVVSSWGMTQLAEQCEEELDRRIAAGISLLEERLHHKHPSQRTRSLSGRAQH